VRRRDWLRGALCLPWLWSGITSRLLAAGDNPARLTQCFGTPPQPQSVQRVFAAGPAAGILVYALTPDKLLNWPLPLTPEQRRYLQEMARQLPFQPRSVDTEGEGGLFASLLPQRPDLIIDIDIVSTVYLTAARNAAANSGTACLLLRGGIGDAPEQLREAGRFLGVTERAESLAVHAEALLARAKTIYAGLPEEERPGVYYAYGPDGLETGARGSSHTEVIEAAGGRNVVVGGAASESADIGRRNNMLRTSLSQISDWNPQYIIASDAAFVRRAAKDSGWRDLPAVRAGNLHTIPDRPFSWFGTPPGINRLAGVNWLLALLYPGQFSVETDLPEATKTFYHRFYGVELSRKDYAALLSNGK